MFYILIWVVVTFFFLSVFTSVKINRAARLRFVNFTAQVIFQ